MTTLTRINPDATAADEPAIPIRLGALEATNRIEVALPGGLRRRLAATRDTAETPAIE